LSGRASGLAFPKDATNPDLVALGRLALGRGQVERMWEVERLIGLDLLPTLDHEALKGAVASELWPRN
jgi:hypothetical protein